MMASRRCAPRLLVLPLLLAGSAWGGLACGGQTAIDEGGGDGVAATGGAGGTASTSKGAPGKGGPPAGGHSSGRGGSGAAPNGKGGAGGLPEYVDPGCPSAPPPLEDYACDPYGKFGACEPGQSCYPYVSYPSSVCGQEIFGAQCVPSGQGRQGESCEAGCENGFICVVTGEGTQCVGLCDLSAAVPCKDGLVCGAVDIPGVGGCI